MLESNQFFPSYLRVPWGISASQVKNIGHGRGVLKFMQWYSTNQSDMRLEKLDASQLVAFGLGWYIIDTLEKKQWQRQLDKQIQQSIEQQRQEERKRELRRMARSGRRLGKSAYGKLQNYYLGFMN